MARHPSPCPRGLPIKITRHGTVQAASRGISETEIKETIAHGRELASEHKGQKGGYISKFYKTFVKTDTGVPMSKSVVAVCEVFDDRYVLVSCYREPTRR